MRQNLHTYIKKLSFVGIITSVFFFFSCEEKKKTEVYQRYNGPLMATENLNVMYSDSGRTTVRLTTARQLKFQNEDEVYPKAVYVTFFDKNGVEYSSLRGDSGRYVKSEGLYKVMGNVFFFNRLKQQSLSTDLLNWSPIRKKVYTDLKFTIKTPLEELHGVGMDADQDFTHYTMRKAKGSFAVDSLNAKNDAAVDTTSN
ncbi:Lipopolysaccharide export system protein LptC [Emticicia aquatica]|jgi:LPS export ABC transporter protein LptC|uniref:Lipopolysaccharide export system protein LptC n=1 Tax=Emticicia aquatica TaxID=1681835 RepID=A0ABN8ER88_9BACT|nr:LPS export ABC transporter periplasmic protein LptC [Emticicia aquatica]CAH0995412.1 Lipopolysaccharide export system protein LptC [Emticicia aquatica]